MSYKTPAIGNRLGISTGWNTDTYPTLHLYSANVQNTVKLYFFIKEYFLKQKKLLITYKYIIRNSLPILYISFYNYRKMFNMQKRNYRQRKQRLIQYIQSDQLAFRKKTKRRFLYTWKRAYKVFQPHVGWHALKWRFLKKKTNRLMRCKQKHKRLLLKRSLNSLMHQYKKKTFQHINFVKNFKRRLKLQKQQKKMSKRKVLKKDLAKIKLFRKKLKNIKRQKLIKQNYQQKKILKQRLRKKLRRKLCNSRKLQIKNVLISKQIEKLKRTLRRRTRLKGWTFLAKKNKLIRILRPKSKRLKTTKKQQIFFSTKLQTYIKKNKLKWVKSYAPDFYNNFITILGLRFNLRTILRNYGFNISNINITEPIKSANKKSIKTFQKSQWFRRMRKQRYFMNTVRLFHLVEKYADPNIIANHFAKEFVKQRKKHWPLILSFKSMIKYWRFHNPYKLNSRELNRRRRFEKNKVKVTNWIPRYKLFSPIDAKKAIRGVKIIVSGKINAANRARQAVLQDGIIPTQSFNKNVNYSLAHARLQTGAFGIKVWMFS